jgi:hypothetical protein
MSATRTKQKVSENVYYVVVPKDIRRTFLDALQEMYQLYVCKDVSANMIIKNKGAFLLTFSGTKCQGEKFESCISVITTRAPPQYGRGLDCHCLDGLIITRGKDMFPYLSETLTNCPRNEDVLYWTVFRDKTNIRFPTALSDTGVVQWVLLECLFEKM